MKAIQALQLVFGAGSVFGPLLLSLVLKFLDPTVFFLTNTVVMGGFAIYVIHSRLVGNKIKPVNPHTLLPTSTSVIPELNEDIESKKNNAESSRKEEV